MHKFSLKKNKRKESAGKIVERVQNPRKLSRTSWFCFCFFFFAFSRRGRPCQNVSPKRAGEKYKRKTWNAEQIIHLSNAGRSTFAECSRKKSNIEVEKLWRAEIREVHCAREVFRFRFSCRYIYCMYVHSYVSGLSAKVNAKEFGK